MSFWQFAAVMGGVAKFHGAKEGLMPEEADALFATLDTWPSSSLH